MTRSESRIAILGSYPPPFGGVATHVMRLVPLLRERELDITVYNLVSESESPPHVKSVSGLRPVWLIRFALTCKENAIFVLSDRIVVWLLIALVSKARGLKYGIRLRNSKVADWYGRSRSRTRLAAYALRNADLVVCVNEDLAKVVGRLGVKSIRTIVAPGFLPPEPGAADWAAGSEDVQLFMSNHEPVIAANGKVNWYEGVDLYGLDMLVGLAESLRDEYPNLGIVVSFWDHREQDEQYLQSLIERAETSGVSGNILFNTRKQKFLPVLSRSRLFVRPTATDGDANSVREALYLGIDAIVSDCVTRPAGTVVFKNRDQQAFVDTVRRTLSGEGKSTELDSNLDAAQRYIDAIAGLAS